MSSYGIAKEGEGGAEVGDGKVRASAIRAEYTKLYEGA